MKNAEAAMLRPMKEGMGGKGFWLIDIVNWIDLSPWHPHEHEIYHLLKAE